MHLDRINTKLEELNESLRERWNKLTNADLSKVGSDIGSLAEVVSKRYNIPLARAKAEAEEFTAGLGSTMANIGSSISEAAHAAGETAADLFREGRNHASELLHKGSDKASELWAEGREQAKEISKQAQSFVRARPMTSLAIAAGAGAVLALLFRRMA